MSLFGDALKTLRQTKHISRLALATELGLSEKYVADIEQGMRGPLQPARIEQIARFLEADARYLIELSMLSRSYLRLDLGDNAQRNRLAVRIVSRWPSLTEAETDAIYRLLGT